MKTYVFIDASNLFYGGKKSLGWSIDQKKLGEYLKEKDNFDRAIVLSGDGDFLPVLKYLRELGKEVLILARGSRTAKEIKRFAGSTFMDFEYLRERLKRTDVDDEEV